MRVILDPNVIISALVSTGTTAAVLDAWLNDQAYEPVVCPTLLDELKDVLGRPKFSFVGQTTVQLLIDRFENEAILAENPAAEPGTTRDPDDDYLVALARETRTSVIVSGDDDLHAFEAQDVEVLSPRDFLDRLAEE